MQSLNSVSKFIDFLVEGRIQKSGGTLLMGEECSLRAGIPSSAELVEAIRKSYPQAYEHASSKNLKACAAELTAQQKTEIFDFYVRKSKVSWAHLCIALLLKEGYITRIMTTSPDPLLERACTLIGEFPAVYDCTVGTITKPDLIPPKAIIHLNGQMIGGTPGPLENVFSGAGGRGPWLVLGFNPEPKDPVYEQLAWMDSVQRGLLWVFSGNTPAPRFIKEHILSKENSFFTNAEGPDAFLVDLIRAMKISSPDLIAYPFTYLGQWLNKVSPYPAPGLREGLNISDISLKQTRAAIQQYEGPDRGGDLGDDEEAAGGVDDPDLLQAIQAARTGLMAGNPQKVIEQHRQYEETPSVQLGHLLNWAYQAEGDASYDESLKLFGKKAWDKLEIAQKSYEMALVIRPDAPATHYQMGRLLVEKAKVQSDQNPAGLLAQSAESFLKALELDPNYYEASYSLGMVFNELAATKSDQETEGLLNNAVKQFQEALRIQPNHPDAAYGCGHVLYLLGRRKKGADAVRAYGQAVEMFKIALHGHPDRIDAILEMGQSLFILSKAKKGDEADRILQMAEEKFQQAVQINHDLAEAQYGWADVLMERANIKKDEASDRFFHKAFEKFELALNLKPDLPRVNFRWGVGLYNMAMKKNGHETIDLLKQSIQKFLKALERNPKNIEILNRLGRVYTELGNLHKGPEAEKLFSDAMDKFHAVLKLQPKNFEALSQVGNVYYNLSMNAQGSTAENLLKSAIEKYQESLKLKPDYSPAIMLWGNSLFRIGTLKLDGTGDKFFDQAEKKYEQALKIHPNDATALTNFGSILLNRAKKEGKEGGDHADALLKKAVDAFNSAVEIQENNPDALNMMGEALMEQARNKRGINAHPLLAEAKGVLQKAEECHPGAGCYNMARLQAQLANETGCRQWLERCQEREVLPDPDTLNGEVLFTSVRESKWFKNLLTAKPAAEPENPKKDIQMEPESKEPPVSEEPKPAANA